MKGKNFKQTAIIILLAVNLIFTIGFVVVPKVSAATGCFPDTNSHWAEEFICWLSDNGIAGGYPDGTFRPENQVTRAEMAVLMKNLSDSYESRITDLENLLASVSLENSGQDFVFTGVNVHVRDGSGDTHGTINGLGNLIVGYNEDVEDKEVRTGSHNLVLGIDNDYTSYGGFVVGTNNTISAEYAAVSGGYDNTASGNYSSVSGGHGNTASGARSSVSGGRDNTASDSFSSVSGGMGNTASGSRSSVSGGYNNTASGDYSSVSGGYYNTASGDYSSVSGGNTRSVSGAYDWKAGTLFETE